MNRRDFNRLMLGSLTAGTAGALQAANELQGAGNAQAMEPEQCVLPQTAETGQTSETIGQAEELAKTVFAQTDENLRFFIPGLKQASKILHVTDTHLFLDDERGKPFADYSKRMAQAYNQTQHYKTGKNTTPMESFEAALAFARRQHVQAVMLTGDIVSFPSEYGVEWLLERLEPLKKDGIAFCYTAGNHDWHYEGTEGSDIAQRNEWIPKRLARLYPENANPLYYAVTIGGVKHLMIDDSVYEILPEQLEFLKAELEAQVPTIVWMHIPPYAPGRSIYYGCGSPDWGAETDRDWEIERRQRWRADGHTATTFAFYDLLCNSPCMLGTLCGHVHRNTLDLIHGKPFLATGANALGAWRLVEFLPFPASQKKG